MGFKTINGKKVFIDDNRRTSSNGRNDESNGMVIGNGTRVPENRFDYSVYDDDELIQLKKDIQHNPDFVINQLPNVDKSLREIEKELNKRNISEGMTFFQGGKAFKVELNEGLGIISVDERFQDKDNVWHTGKNIVFAQGEDGQDLADDAGGFFVDKIMEHLDSAGALEGAR